MTEKRILTSLAVKAAIAFARESRAGLLFLMVAPIFLALSEPGVAQNQISPVRLMTYNTALMNLSANVYVIGAPTPVIPISIDTNKDLFGGKSYGSRIWLMSEYIKKEDPDVVVLNEVWDDTDKDTFVRCLALNGPYPFYIKKISGSQPGMNNPFAVPGTASELDLVANALGSPQGTAALVFISQLLQPFLPGLEIVGVDVKYQDSGLMLFSKKPFAPFTATDYWMDPRVSVEGFNGPFPLYVAARVYDGARGMDQLASKAVGLVRIQEGPSSVIDVAFSHTNADEGPPEENADVRAYQMKQVKELLLSALTPAQLKTEQLFMLGDLNTPGTNKKYGTDGEWFHLFWTGASASPFNSNPGLFFACGNSGCSGTGGTGLNPAGSFMKDSWGSETSVEDRNTTNYIDDQYYDYVLHNEPFSADRFHGCMQHIRIGSEMKDDVNGIDLSDHLPVHVDFNIAAAQCSPDENSPYGPRVVTFTQAISTRSFNLSAGARILYPGNMQWYKIPAAGTYWIKIIANADHVGFDVYEEDDLSNPIDAYHGESDPRKGLRFVTSLPLFVRVYAINPDGTPDRTWADSYSIQFHQSFGRTPDDSIGLKPAMAKRLKYTWVSSGTDQPTVWFDFYTNQTINKAFAHSTIINESIQGGDWLLKPYYMTSELYDQIGTNPYLPSSYKLLNLAAANPGGYKPYTAEGASGQSGFQIEMPDLPGTPNALIGTEPRKYFYKLTRSSDFGPLPQNLSTYLTFLTDLQYMQAKNLRSWVPLSWDHELASLGFNFDLASVVDACSPIGQIQCTTLQTNSPSPDPLPGVNWLQGPFHKSTVPTLWVLPPYPDAQWVQLGMAPTGSKIYPISITREEDGNPKCKVGDATGTNPKYCKVMVISQPYGSDYDYWLYYTVTHDIN